MLRAIKSYGRVARLYSSASAVLCRITPPSFCADFRGACLAFAGLLFLGVKLFVVSGNEILAENYDPATYAAQSVGQAYMAFPPVYPWWLGFSSALGLPQRIAIEIVFFVAAAFLSFKLRPAIGKLAALVTFFAVFFGPVSLFLFDHILSEALYVCLMMLAVALSIICINKKEFFSRILSFCVLGLIFGVMALTRNEIPVLIAWAVLLSLAVFVADGFKNKAWGKRIFRGGVLSGVSMAALFTVVIINSTFNYVLEGVFATSLPQLPSHMAMLSKLASIDDGQSSIRFVPISKKARDLAYDASPLLATLRARVEAPDGVFHIASRNSGLPEGEIGAGWIWHTFNAALGERDVKDAKYVDEFYRGVNHELDLAFSKGILKKKAKLISLLSLGADPLVVLGRSFISVLKSSVSYVMPSEDAHYQSNLFDRVANRRSWILDAGDEGLIKGWVATPSAAIESVTVLFSRDDGQTLRVVADLFDRPDVQKGLLEEGRKEPSVVGYRANSGSSRYRPTSVIYKHVTGEKFEVDGFVGGRVTLLSKHDDPRYVIQGIDEIKDYGVALKRGIGRNYQARVVDLFSGPVWWWVVGLFLGVGALFSVYLLMVLASPMLRVGGVTYLFLLSLCVARVGFYSLLDAGGWAVPLRYLQPTAWLIIVLVVFSGALFASATSFVLSTRALRS